LDHHKGWPVLITIAALGVLLLLMLLWFVIALLFRLRFQFGIRSLLVLPVALAIACSWMTVEVKEAREQKAAMDELVKCGARISSDLLT